MKRPHPILPATRWVSGYDGIRLRSDLAAGLTVGVMLIPQAMAYALLAGVPPVYGLYASLVPLVVYALFGTSLHLAVGIMAIDCLIVLSAVSRFADPGSDRYVTLVILLAAITGLIQLGMALARFGFVVALLSRPVLAGFASGAAVTIGFSQLPGLLGASYTGSLGVPSLVVGLPQLLSSASLWPAAIGLGGLILLYTARRIRPSAPGALLILILSVILVSTLDLDQRGVEVVGVVPSGLPTPSLVSVELADVRSLFPLALTLALVQFTTVVSLGKVFAARHGYRVAPNRELVALGAMNVLGSLFKSIPVSGSFSRTAVNETAGAATPASNLVAALLIALTLLFFTPAFYFLPMPVLAALIMFATFSMVDVRELRLLLKTKRIDGLIALVTFAVTVLVGIQEGIVVGIAASIIAVMARITRPEVVELGHLPGTRLYREMSRTDGARRVPGLYILRFDASFSFANADFIRDHILSHLEGSPETRAILLDASSINDVDMTAVEVLLDIYETLGRRQVRLILSGVKGRVTDIVDSAGLTARIGEANFFMSNHRAVVDVLEQRGLSEADLNS